MSSNYKKLMQRREAQRFDSTRLYTPEPNKTGMPAEREWHHWCGLKQDLRYKAGGDGGIDVVLNLNLHGRPTEVFSDVKATQFHGRLHKMYLCVDPKDLDTEAIYVLAEAWAIDDRAKLMGWHWGWRVQQQTPSNELGSGPRHLLPQTELNHMDELRQILIGARHSTEAEWKRRQGCRST